MPHPRPATASDITISRIAFVLTKGCRTLPVVAVKLFAN
jgi:hypothetical protein